MDEPDSRTLFAVLAALFPVPFHLIASGLVLPLVGAPEEVAQTIEAGGPYILASAGVAFLGALANTVLLFLLVRGARVPVVLPLILAAAPCLLPSHP